MMWNYCGQRKLYQQCIMRDICLSSGCSVIRQTVNNLALLTEMKFIIFHLHVLCKTCTGRNGSINLVLVQSMQKVLLYIFIDAGVAMESEKRTKISVIWHCTLLIKY